MNYEVILATCKDKLESSKVLRKHFSDEVKKYDAEIDRLQQVIREIEEETTNKSINLAHSRHIIISSLAEAPEGEHNG